MHLRRRIGSTVTRLEEAFASSKLLSYNVWKGITHQVLQLDRKKAMHEKLRAFISNIMNTASELWIKENKLIEFNLVKHIKLPACFLKCAVNKTEKVEEVAPEIIAAARDVQEKKETYTPYNILPLDAAGASQSIMQLEEIKSAVASLWNTRGLNWPYSFEQHKQRSDLHILDWIRAMFGFQLDDRAVDAVMKKLFKNYKTWCKFLDVSIVICDLVKLNCLDSV